MFFNILFYSFIIIVLVLAFVLVLLLHCCTFDANKGYYYKQVIGR